MRPSGLASRSLAFAGLVACGCAHTPSPSGRDGFQVILEDAARSTSSGSPQPANYTAAWITYATIRGRTYEEVRDRGSRNRAGDDYLIEVRARSGMAAFWRDQRQTPEAASDAYLDKLVEIAEAGFIEEYVLGTFARPGWTVPSKELPLIDFASFAEWGPVHLGALESPTLAWMKPSSGKLDPNEPGAGLPDPEALVPPRGSCRQSLGVLRRAVAEWEVEASALDGFPVAATDRAGFIRQIVELAAEAPYRTRGMTWVSPRPLFLAHLAGFCGVEAKDYEFAERSLRRAIELSPRLPGPRLELAHVLVTQGQLDQADAAIEVVFDSAKDRCDLGLAWRKRGYIRFEQGRLDDARSAYLRSLDHDPRSDLAVSELALLESEIEKRGGDVTRYVPPLSREIITACPRD